MTSLWFLCRCHLDHTIRDEDLKLSIYIISKGLIWISVWRLVFNTLCCDCGIYTKRTKVFVHRQISMYRLCHLSTKNQLGTKMGIEIEWRKIRRRKIRRGKFVAGKFVAGRFVAWKIRRRKIRRMENSSPGVTLFSFFPFLNALKNLSIVLFNPFYYIIRIILYKTTYISIKTLHSFLISFTLSLLPGSHFSHSFLP